MRSPFLPLLATFALCAPLAAFADGYTCASTSSGYYLEITTSSDGAPPKNIFTQGHATLSQGSQELAKLTCSFLINAEDSDGDPRFYECDEHVTNDRHFESASGYQLDLIHEKGSPDGVSADLKLESQSLGKLKCKKVNKG